MKGSKKKKSRQLDEDFVVSHPITSHHIAGSALLINDQSLFFDPLVPTRSRKLLLPFASLWRIKR